MRTVKVNFVLLLFLSLSTGCSSTKSKYLFKSIIDPTPVNYIQLSDSHKSIFYTYTIGDQNNVKTILFFLTGSGHSSLQYYLKSYFQGIEGNVKIYALQKRHVSNRSTGLFKPNKAYDENNTLEQRIKDSTEFIRFILKSENIDNKRIVIFGVSEGGAFAPAVANSIDECTHLAVLGAGGMKGIDAFRFWGKRHNINFDHKYHEMKDEPDKSGNRFLGHYTYRYWLSMLEFDPMIYLKDLDIPIFYSFGAKDDMVPIESVYYLQEEFNKLGKNNLTINFYPDCNHVLVDSEGKSYVKEFMKDLSQWWRGSAEAA